MAVHGVGRQRKGETLAEVAEALALTIEETTPDDHVLERAMDISGRAASATLRIEDAEGNVATWSLTEAMWSGSFTAPPANAVFLWIARSIPRQARYLFGLLRQAGNDPHEASPILMGPHLWFEHMSSWNARLQIVLLAVLLLVISPFLITIGLAFIYLQRVPLHVLHPFDPFLSRVLGDVYRYTTHGMWAASARGIVERAIIDFIEDDRDPVEGLTILAHSMGCVVAYDALRGGGAVADSLRRAEQKGRRPKITLVTVGSGINQVFAVARRSQTYGRQHFCQPLDPAVTGRDADDDIRDGMFEWVDIYARMDLVPAGGLAPEVRARCGIGPGQYVEVRVSNTNLPFKDHTSYFQNREAVVPRIIRAINGGEEYRPPEPEAAASQASGGTGVNGAQQTRRHRVLVAVVRTLLPAVLIGAAAAIWLTEGSPEDGFVDSFRDGPWPAEAALVLVALWVGRLFTAGLMVLATVGIVGGWAWVADSLFDDVWFWLAASGPWAVELAVVYAAVLWALYLRKRRGRWPGQGEAEF